MMTMRIDGGDYGEGWICRMKMRNNVLVVDVFETSRISIPWPRYTKKGEGDPRCAAPRLEPPVQVHPLHYHAEDVAVAEHVDGLEEGYKRTPRRGR